MKSFKGITPGGEGYLILVALGSENFRGRGEQSFHLPDSAKIVKQGNYEATYKYRCII